MAKMPRIMAPLGKLLSFAKGDLTERRARPSLVGYRRAQQWRSVITGLTPERLAHIYRSIAQGTWTPDFYELAEEMEERDLHYRGVLQQRKLKAAGSPLDVLPASEDPRDQAIADEVRMHILEGPGFHNMLVDLLDAIAKGVSCQEIVWRMEGMRWKPAQYHRVDPRWLTFDPEDGETPYLVGERALHESRSHAPSAGPGARWSAMAEPLMPGKFLYHAHKSKSGLPGRAGLAYAIATIYLLKSVAVKDWWAFAEVFGLPVRVGKYGPNASDDDIRTLELAIRLIASDAGCVIPDSMEIAFEQAARSGGGTSSEMLFEGMANWCDSQTSIAVVGQTMTTKDGSSLAQAKVHQEVRGDITEDDVRQACDTVSSTVVAWYCELNHGSRPPAGWPRVAPPADEDAVNVEELATAAKAGLRIPATWVRERMGIPEPQGDEEVLTGRPSDSGEPDPPPEDLPRPAPNSPALHAAEDELAEADWIALEDDLLGPVLEALNAAGNPHEFLELATRAELPDTLARDLAQACFEARVEGETDPRE